MTASVTPIDRHPRFKPAVSPYYAKNGFVYIRSDLGDECLLPVEVEQSLSAIKTRIATSHNHLERGRLSHILSQLKQANEAAINQREMKL